MITRWIFQTLWGSVTDTIDRGWHGVKTETKILATSIYDFVAKPSEKQIKKARDATLDKYQATVDQVRKRQEERDKMSKAHHAVDNTEQQELFRQFQKQLSALFDEVKQELYRLNHAYLPFLWRNQIKAKCAERNALNILLATCTLSELKIVSERQQPILAAESGKNSALSKLLEIINHSNVKSKLEIIPPIRRY